MLEKFKFAGLILYGITNAKISLEDGFESKHIPISKTTRCFYNHRNVQYKKASQPTSHRPTSNSLIHHHAVKGGRKIRKTLLVFPLVTSSARRIRSMVNSGLFPCHTENIVNIFSCHFSLFIVYKSRVNNESYDRR